jgi:RNA polymerase sigma-70 factor (ECF subfamily)
MTNPERGPRRFATTRWSLVVAAGDSRSPDASSALATLCETYWFPVYAFIRRSGRSHDDARDLTQAFFARVLEKNYFKDAKAERGRFRSFLLSSVRHFLSNQLDWDRAQKRGGDQLHISIDADDGDQQYQHEPVEDETPERIYERRWALAAMGAAMTRLAARYEPGSRRELFERLKPFLTGDEPESYAALGAELGVSEGSLRVAVHRLRRQFATVLREAIAETVEAAGDVDEELRHLLAVVSR